MTTTETMTPQDVRELQTIVPLWMDDILSKAESEGKNVSVTRLHTPFGTYTTDIKVEGE